ncbi:unnamed protein product [Dibothriocephalus latus]|uniref:CRAL-TRIO domain-containing protein n=1 Tax=Dibothriocephalus latus TaxID=60516 RepID=A0A3P7NZ66_DIBLA|nr:unnamed protein product [Dibothriocephalus latus]
MFHTPIPALLLVCTPDILPVVSLTSKHGHSAKIYSPQAGPKRTLKAIDITNKQLGTIPALWVQVAEPRVPVPSLRKSVSSSTSLRAAELIPLLRKKIAMLPGGRTRTGGPILCFPANTHADELPLEDLYLLVRYLTYLPDDNVKKLGFTVIIDMRSGTTWHSVKPILRVIEECIGGNVAMAYIIKPDKFFEKQKAQMALGKYSFETQLVSVESLFNEVDPSQLTADLEGSLPYSHSEWIQIRCCLEDFFMFAHDMSDKFGQLYCFLDRKQNPETVEESKRSLEEHRSLRLKVLFLSCAFNRPC